MDELSERGKGETGEERGGKKICVCPSIHQSIHLSIPPIAYCSLFFFFGLFFFRRNKSTALACFLLRRSRVANVKLGALLDGVLRRFAAILERLA